MEIQKSDKFLLIGLITGIFMIGFITGSVLSYYSTKDLIENSIINIATDNSSSYPYITIIKNRFIEIHEISNPVSLQDEIEEARKRWNRIQLDPSLNPNVILRS